MDRDNSESVNFVEISGSIRDSLNGVCSPWNIIDPISLKAMFQKLLHKHNDSVTCQQFTLSLAGSKDENFLMWMQYVLGIVWPREREMMEQASAAISERIERVRFERIFVAKVMFLTLDDDNSGVLEGREITMNRWLKKLLTDVDLHKLKEAILRLSESSDSVRIQTLPCSSHCPSCWQL